VTGVQVLASLPPDVRGPLTERSDGRGLRHLAGHGGAILLTGTLIAAQVPLWWLLLPVHGVLLVFLFTLEHECTHGTPFASRRLNEGIGHAGGAVLLLPFLWFRYFHLAHHRWTNLPGQDPELEGGRPESRLAWAWHVTGLPVWRAQITTIIRLAAGREAAGYLPKGAMARITREARLLCLLYVATLLSLLVSPLAFWLWILPLLLGQPLLRVYLLAEHGDCPQVADMLLNTRTTFTGVIVRTLAWNMPYHAEHHLWPAVPFHQLPALHAHIRPHLGVTAEGYLAFTREYLGRRSAT
jgi:fatty acid desaturase